MKKSKEDSSLIDLVITDNYPVCKELGTLLKHVDSNNKWIVVCSAKALEFSKKNDGYTDEYKPLYKINAKEIDKNAVKAKNIWIATCPDVRGDYLAFKINEHIKKVLKLNCSVYRMRLCCINEETVLNSILNKQNIVLDKEVQLHYESYAVIDHAISVNVSKLFSEYFPFNFDIYLHTGILLDFIDRCRNPVVTRQRGFYSSITPYNEEIVSKEPITCSLVKTTKISKVSSLDSLFLGLSGFVSWYGLASCLYEAYSRGCITYPTSDVCRKTPKSFKIDGVKSSKKNWGILWLKKDDSLLETSNSILSEVYYQNNNKRYFHELKYSQKEDFFIHRYALGNKKEPLTCGNWSYTRIGKNIGVGQLDILYFIKYLGFSTKLIPWFVYSLIKSGLIVYTTDTTIVLTSLGKFLLMLIKNNIPILLKHKYIINTLKGIKDLSSKDELHSYEFMQRRIDKVTSLVDPSYENFVIPKCSQKCICGKKYAVTINNKNVFATCSNNKCRNSGKVFPINIKNNSIEVLYD